MAPKEGPTESAPYGQPRVDPLLLRDVSLLFASVMLGEKTPEKGWGTGTRKRDSHEKTVEIDMTSPPAAVTFHARAAYSARVDEEASTSAACQGGSSGEAKDPWVMDPWPGIWTMGGRSVGEAEPRPREDMEIRGVYSHFPGTGSSGGIRLVGVIALDVGDAVMLEALGV